MLLISLYYMESYLLVFPFISFRIFLLYMVALQIMSRRVTSAWLEVVLLS